MQSTRLVSAVGLAALLSGCRSPAAKDVPKHPVPVAEGFRPVVAGCARARFRVARLGTEVVLVGVRIEADHRAHVAVLEPRSGRQRAVASDAHDELSSDSAFSEGDITIDGSSWDAFRVRVSGSCAPDLNKPGGPVVCREVAIRVAGARVSSTITSVPTGALAGVQRSVPAPAGWEKDVATWQRREPACVVDAWLPLSRDLVFARSDSRCSFGGGALLSRSAGMTPVTSARGEDDNLVVSQAAGVWWVGWGVDRHVERLWRVSGEKLVPIALPSKDAADDLLVVGDEPWLTTHLGAFVHRAAGWTRVEACPVGTAVEVEVLDSQRALLRCADGRVVALDARDKAQPPLAYVPARHEATWRWQGLVLDGRPEIWLLHEPSATLLQSRYDGATWSCKESGPLVMTAGYRAGFRPATR